MICILLAVLCSSAVSVIMKVSDRHGQSGYAILCMNYIFASVFSLTAALRSGLPEGMTFPFWAIGILTGVLFLACFVVSQFSIGRNGATLSAVFMKMGILVPILLSFLLWHEKPSGLQIFGMVLAISAILIMTLRGEKKAERMGQALWALPLLLVLAGTSDSMSKFYTLYGVGDLNAWYMFLTFFTALILCFPMMLIRKECFDLPKLGLGSALGLVNYAGTWFMLMAVSQFPSYLVYPTVNVGVIVVVAVVSRIAFRERLGKRQILGLVLVLAAVALLNL